MGKFLGDRRKNTKYISPVDFVESPEDQAVSSEIVEIFFLIGVDDDSFFFPLFNAIADHFPVNV